MSSATDNLGNEVSIQNSFTIGASDVVISKKKLRKSYVIRNLSTAGQVITISLNNDTIATNGVGIVLNVNDYITDTNSGNYKCWTGDIHAIASAGGGTLAIFETW